MVVIVAGWLRVDAAERLVEAVEALRGAGPDGDQATAILDAEVWQHEIATSARL